MRGAFKRLGQDGAFPRASPQPTGDTPRRGQGVRQRLFLNVTLIQGPRQLEWA